MLVERNTAISFLLLLAVATSYTLGQGTRPDARCLDMKTCGQCLGAGEGCAWCSQENFQESTARCGNESVLVARGCDFRHIVNPRGSVTYNKNEAPRNADRTYDAIQLSPQEITLKIRPHEPIKFKTSFRLAENYPVDLYFVMDLSVSMKDDKEKLATLGDQLVSVMRNLTANFRFGFGSFVDKKAMPYVSTVPERLIEPCDGCAAPFGFHNILPLTDDTSKFVKEVEDAQISGNLDNFEGGFDAIMQAVLCKSEIGWRNQSRKILLYSTDGGFHCAGDGKLAGIVVPNDQQCHLDREGYYSESLTQDYPSISQLSQSITDNNVNVIFAVTDTEQERYGSLSAFIRGSTIGNLASDSSNIIDLIRDNYNKISGSIELRADAGEDISVSFKTKCKNGSKELEGEKSIMCNELHLAETVTFDVTVEATSCPADKNQWKKSFKIYPVGLTEKLVVNVELSCECECELPQYERPNSPMCNSGGTYLCGSCQCNDGRFGDTCQCDESTIGSEDHLKLCKRSSTSEVCEGRGQCLCGKCACNPISTLGDQSRRFSGTYCECNDYSCDYHNGLLCGGPDHGVCNCGICDCLPDWSKPDCSCSKATHSCMTSDGKLCNGRGDCVCGSCVCDPASGYQGPKCESCPLCASKCDTHRPCVECSTFQNYANVPQDICQANCSHVVKVTEFNTTDAERNSSWVQCPYRIGNCNAMFRYHQSDETKVEALTSKECPESVDLFWIIFAVILGIILVGILLLVVWKVIITIKDRREYARFDKARENAKWDAGENPIYKQATTTYQNPHYSKAD